MMNKKDVEAYQKSYEEIDIFLAISPLETYGVRRVKDKIR